MRTRFIRILCLFSILTLLFSHSFSPAAYNDRRFSTYINMGDNAVSNNYQIPHMFRQDAPYTYITQFPLVVSGGVEYVPLSMFILYSYIEVNYSGLDSNFYLINNRNGNYISFNVEDNLAETSNGEIMRMETRIFHKTRYVPARKVASALSMMCETYDDPLNGIYAFRISNGKSAKTLVDLLTPYLPAPKEEIKPEQPSVPEQPSGDSGKTEQPNTPTPDIVKPKPEDTQKPVKPTEPETTPEDPLEKLKNRNVSLCFTGSGYENFGNVVNTVRAQGIDASFSFTKDEILSNPSDLRSLYIDGYSIFVTAEPDFNAVAEQNSLVPPEQLELLYANAFIAELENANKAMNLVLKTKSRICTLPYGLPDELRDSEVFKSTVNQAGYIIYEPNIDSGDVPGYSGSAYTVSSIIKNRLTGGKETDSVEVTALLHMSDKSYYYLLDIASLVNKYDGISFFKTDEFTLFNAR